MEMLRPTKSGPQPSLGPTKKAASFEAALERQLEQFPKADAEQADKAGAKQSDA
jgi:hypothetical protein